MHAPDASLWSSRTKTSLKFGSQAQGTGWEQNRWPRKWTWTVSKESTSLSLRCSRNARPPLICRNRCLRDGSMFAENKTKVASLLKLPSSLSTAFVYYDSGRISGAVYLVQTRCRKHGWKLQHIVINPNAWVATSKGMQTATGFSWLPFIR